VCSFFVVIANPLIEIGLQLLDAGVDLFAKCYLVELLQNGLVKAFADAVGLRTPGLRLCVIDVLDRQVELILVVLAIATVRAT